MRIAVFCSARSDIERSWIDDTINLGDWIGKSGNTLVYGGVELGLMKILADSARKAGGKTVGIVPIKRQNAEDRENSINIHVGDLNHRKEAFMQLADVFVALPGGYGTLDEIVSVFTSLRFSEDSRKLIILNSDKLYENLRLQYYAMIEHGLLEPAFLKSMIFVDTIKGVIENLSQVQDSLLK